jgi:hypothetical protein
MDGSRFDALARTLTTAGSRRRVLGSLSGVAVGALGTVLTLPRIEAKTRHSRGNAKKDNGKKGQDHSTHDRHGGETCDQEPRHGTRPCQVTAPPCTARRDGTLSWSR